jgi:MFS family permease
LLRRTLNSGISAHVDAASRDGARLANVFLRWVWWRAVLHKGWWLVTSVYLVVDAGLSPSELVLIGCAQGIVALVFEIPAGVVADTISRKWSLVASHALMGTAMLATGLATNFGPLVATQMLWGLSWTFASGADVAWITDELDQPARISVVLMRSGRAQLTGAAAGLVGVGALAWLTQRSTAMVLAGAAMLALGVYVVARFPEQRFVPASTRRWSASWSILVDGSTLVRRSRAILLMFTATFLVTAPRPPGGYSPGGSSTSGSLPIPSSGSPPSASSPCSSARPRCASWSAGSMRRARRSAATRLPAPPEPSGPWAWRALPRQ